MDYDKIRLEAIEAGFDEVQADAIIATLKAREKSGKVSDYLLDYPAWKTGNYTASKGGNFSVDNGHIEQTSRAVNMLHATGKPVQMIDGHRSTNFLGAMPATRTGLDGKLRAAIVGDMNTIAGLRERALSLSIEAKQFYNSEEYTKGEEFRYWPTAWAVIPAGTQPAVTPGEPLAAEEIDNNPVRLYAQETNPNRGDDPRKGDDMDLEKKIEALEASEAVKDSTISALETENSELKSKLEAAEKERDSFVQAKEAAEIEAAEKVVETKLEEMLAKKLPGKREQLKADIMAAEGSEARSEMIELLDRNVPDMTAPEQVLHAGDGKPEEKKDNADNAIEAAEKRAENGENYLEALAEEFSKAKE